MRILGLLAVFYLSALAGFCETPASQGRVRTLKITILSTMLADGLDQTGEWGFSALVEADGHRILFDTGEHTDTVLKNAKALDVDLSNVPEAVLSHNHGDHTGGLLTLRRAMMAKAPSALAIVHVGEGIFYPRTSFNPGIEHNPALLLKPEFEKTGGVFVSHDKPAQLYTGVWLTGPVPRKYPERNWSGSGRVHTPAGWVEDNIPEDQSLVFDTDKGLVVLLGCGHAGIINTLEYARSIVRPAPVHAVIGGIHLFAASDETLDWTATKLGEFGMQNFIGAHCTGIEPVFRFRTALHLDRRHCVVAAVGSSFDLSTGIEAGNLAQ
ncbi:MAG TPA: MBL fold metallo-hydrolase [Opitutaceae bacterium]|jgi:7,8-dihydropterin-6-yl-methyl-4-(beta-D-ribofuranosyl)aminobenzene 5'-phosphate synthase|nr:MBL fold metallo-hydrolase [Opitutaceae bacterium]